jgi:branched-chain amino acid transport system ATP-binding protein
VNLLSVKGVSKSFRGLKAVSDASFELPEGTINALIGPNGAGKTTLFNIIAGVYRPDSGKIEFLGKEIQGLRPDQICAAGIGRTFQIVKPFAGLTVLENVMVGGFLREKHAAAARKISLEIVEKLGLASKSELPASSLTLPDRKRLEVARALATRPKLLLLDEVMAGLNPTEIDEVVLLVKRIRDEGVSILVIEHVMKAIRNLSDRVFVLHHGEKIAEGTPDTVFADPRVVEAYLGRRRQ